MALREGLITGALAAERWQVSARLHLSQHQAGLDKTP